MDKKLKNECDTQRKQSHVSLKGNEATDDCGQMDDIIGGFGKYQFMIFMFKILIGVTSAFNNLGVTFFAPSQFVSYWCADLDTLSGGPLANQIGLSPNLSSIANANSTLSYGFTGGPSYIETTSSGFARNHTLDAAISKAGQYQGGPLQLFGEFVSGDERRNKHKLNINSDKPDRIRIWISTIIDEWDLVCDRAWFVSVTQSLYMAGFIVAYLMFGHVSDRFGRWNSLLLGAIIEISSGFGCAFATSVTQFMIFRFLLGLGNAGRSSSSYLIMIEWTGIRWRMHISTLGSLGWVVGYCAMPWITLYFLHFRHMQLFVCFYEIVFLFWLLRLPESPRWLLTHKRFSEAYDVLMMAAKFNGLISNEDDKNSDILGSSTGNLVLEKSTTCPTSSKGLSEHSYGAVKSNLNNSKDRHDGHRVLLNIGENSDRTNDVGCEIKQRKGSLVPTSVDDIVKPAFERNNALSFYASLFGACTNWFCGEGQVKDLKPYTERQFNAKFEKLTNFIEAKEFTKNEDRLSMVDLFKWRNLRKYTFILAFAWAVNSFIYYGIALGVGDLGGKNLFIAFSFAGATELPSIAFTMICMKMLPRKTTNLFLFSAIFFLCALQVPLKYYDCQWLQQMTMMLAKLFNSCSFTCILYQTMELFPTSIRQTAYSSCSLAGRIGSILAPFVKELSQITNAFIPPIIYAILSILEIFFIKHLPETQGIDLPDTLLEAEKFKGTDSERRRMTKKENGSSV